MNEVTFVSDVRFQAVMDLVMRQENSYLIEGVYHLLLPLNFVRVENLPSKTYQSAAKFFFCKSRLAIF